MRLAGGSREGVLAIGDEPPSAASRPRFADLLAITVVAALYVVAAKLGLKLAFIHASATAVWPPAGIALAALLLLTACDQWAPSWRTSPRPAPSRHHWG